jgi:hypothetical protein
MGRTWLEVQPINSWPPRASRPWSWDQTGHEGEAAQHLGPGIWDTPEDWNRSDRGRGPGGAKTGLRLPPRQPSTLFGRAAPDDDSPHQDSASIPRSRIACKACVEGGRHVDGRRSITLLNGMNGQATA